jgi:hypothetical protein
VGRWDQNGSWGNWLGGCGLDSTISGQGPVAGCCECSDEPSGSCATELVSDTGNSDSYCAIVQQEILCIIHNTFVSVAQICSPTNLILLHVVFKDLKFTIHDSII